MPFRHSDSSFSSLIRERKANANEAKNGNKGSPIGRFPSRKQNRKFRWEQKWNFRLVKSCSIWP